eukprot:4730237-Pleurochrysis_carterae.AAC.2
MLAALLRRLRGIFSERDQRQRSKSNKEPLFRPQVEAANTLRSLKLRAESSSDHTQAGTVEVCLSKECVAEAQVVASRLALDEALFMQERSKTAAKSDEMRIISFGPPEAHLTATTPCSVTIHAPEHLVSFSVMDFFRKFKLNK